MSCYNCGDLERGMCDRCDYSPVDDDITPPVPPLGFKSFLNQQTGIVNLFVSNGKQSVGIGINPKKALALAGVLVYNACRSYQMTERRRLAAGKLFSRVLRETY